MLRMEKVFGLLFMAFQTGLSPFVTLEIIGMRVFLVLCVRRCENYAQSQGREHNHR